MTLVRSQPHALPALALAASMLAFAPHALAQTTEQAIITASDAGGSTLDFGNSVSIDGETLVVGAPAALDGNMIDTGAAYVYVRAGGVWTQQAKLLSAHGAGGDLFGVSVSIDGDSIVVGARWHEDNGTLNSGAAFVFTRSGAVWTEQAELIPSDPDDFAWFGHSVSISGDRVIVGSPFRSGGAGFAAGAAYVYTRSGTAWTEDQKLTAFDAAGSDFYGWSVAISGDTAVVGSEFDDDNGTDSGSAYVYLRGGSTWNQQQKLTASDGAIDHQFGVSVDIDGDTIIAGALMSPFMAPCCNGAAYVFDRTMGVWTEQQKLTPSDGALDDKFGVAVAVDGDAVAVGSFFADAPSTDSGAVYYYERDAGTWSEIDKFVASNGAADDWLGDSVALSGTTIVGGATPADAVYVFDLMPQLGGLFCFGNACPCGNDDPSAGCANSTGSGAFASGTGGSTSVALDDLVLSATNFPPNNSGLWFMGATTFTPVFVGDGMSCTGGLFRFIPSAVDASGVFTITNLVAQAPAGQILAGDTRHFTAWTRDVLCGPPPTPCPTPCGQNSNLSNGVSIAFTP